jgi:hypothetical protein
MPRKSKPDPAQAPAVPEVALHLDKKTYLIGGGNNQHGSFLKIVEIINGRKNTVFMDHARWVEIREAINEVAGQVADLPLVTPAEALA